MKLYKAGPASIVVSDGTIDNGTGLSVTVTAGAAVNLAWTGPPVVDNGTLSTGCIFTCTWTSAGQRSGFTATVSVTDAYGNIVSNIGAGHTVALGGVEGSWDLSFTGTPGNRGRRRQSPTFTTRGANNWTTDVITATSSGYAQATVNVTK